MSTRDKTYADFYDFLLVTTYIPVISMRTPPTTPRTYAMPGSASGQLEQC
jgi:hypothetical protein